MQHIYGSVDGSAARMHCSACARVRFRSDTKSLRIKLGFSRRARQITLTSLLVNGKHDNTFGCEPGTNTAFEGEIFRSESRESRTFDLWLPHMCETWIESLEIDSEASLEAAEKPAARWLVYGDSITQGMAAHRPVDICAARIASMLDVEPLNVAVGGAICDPRLAENVPDIECDIVSIAYGTNNIGRGTTLAEFIAASEALIEAIVAKYPGVPIVIVSPPVVLEGRTHDAHGSSMDEYRDALKNLVESRNGCAYVHGLDLVPGEQRYFADKVHPNGEGFACYADAMAAKMSKLLASAKP